MIVINSIAFDKIISHAKKTYPEEGCGALTGKDGEERCVFEAVPLENRVTVSRHNRYVIDADDVSSVEQGAKSRNQELVGFFHSHPNAPAKPSQFDLEHSWPWYSYVIVSVNHSRPEGIVSWRLRDDRSKFDKEELVRVD